MPDGISAAKLRFIRLRHARPVAEAFSHVRYFIATSNAKKEASKVFLTVRWFGKENRVVATSTTHVKSLAPGGTPPFQTYTDKNPEIVRYEVTIKSVRE